MHTDYIIRVSRTRTGEYRATAQHLVAGAPADVLIDPREPAAIGHASTARAAALMALINAEIPEIPAPELSRA